MKKSLPAASVDEYLSELPPKTRMVLEKIRQTIRKTAPEAEELISFHIPSYKQDGPLVHFASFKTHCGFYVVNPLILKKFESELNGFELMKNGFRFSPEKPPSASLVSRIVKERIKENQGATNLKRK